LKNNIFHETPNLTPSHNNKFLNTPLEGNPLENIDVVINNVMWVMKSAQIVVDKTDSAK